MSDGLSGADLHLHTVYSDGIYTPESLVRAAIGRCLRVVAVTDHDSISAVAPARAAAQGTGLEVVAGIEIAVPLEEVEAHVIGLFVDSRVEAMRRRLVELRVRRRERILESIRRLGRLGIHVDAEEVFAGASPALPGRAHLAHTMAARGAVPSFNAAFQRYLGHGKPAYVRREWPSPEDAIRIVHDAGGLAVYAHPLMTGHDEVIPRLVEAGLDAIEVNHPGHQAAHREHYRCICREYGLLPSAGTDCHGTSPDGGAIGTARLTEDEFEALRQAAAARAAALPENAE